MLSAKFPWPNIYMMPANIGKEPPEIYRSDREPPGALRNCQGL